MLVGRLRFCRGRPGLILGCLGAILGTLGLPQGPPGPPRDPLGTFQGAPGIPLGGPIFCTRLEREADFHISSIFGNIFFERGSRDRPGPILGRLGAVLGPSWGHFGTMLGSSWAVLAPWGFRKPLKNIRIS